MSGDPAHDTGRGTLSKVLLSFRLAQDAISIMSCVDVICFVLNHKHGVGLETLVSMPNFDDRPLLLCILGGGGSRDGAAGVRCRMCSESWHVGMQHPP